MTNRALLLLTGAVLMWATTASASLPSFPSFQVIDPAGVAATHADLDGDGVSEVIVATTQSLKIYARGILVRSRPVSVPMGMERPEAFLAVSHPDAAGVREIVLATWDSVDIFRHTDLEPVASLPFGLERIVLADVNGDGRQDLIGERPWNISRVEACRRISGCGFGILVLLRSGDTFSAPLQLGRGIGPFAIADADRDGDDDVVTLNGESIFGVFGLSMFPNLGGGQFGERRMLAANSDPGGLELSLAVLDIDSDGRLDAVTNFDYNAYTVRGFTDLRQPYGDAAWSVVRRPLDNVRSAILLANETATPWVVFVGKNALWHIPDPLASDVDPVQLFATPEISYAAAAGDIDGDGLPDALVVAGAGALALLGSPVEPPPPPVDPLQQALEQINVLKADLKAAEVEIATLSAEKAALSADNAALVTANATLAGEVERLASDNSRLTADNARLSSENADLRARVTSAEAKLTPLLLRILGEPYSKSVALSVVNFTSQALEDALAATNRDARLVALRVEVKRLMRDLTLATTSQDYRRVVHDARKIYQRIGQVLGGLIPKKEPRTK